MKILIFLFSFSVITTWPFPAEKGIDYDHKKINKEVSKRLSVETGMFTKEELDIVNPEGLEEGVEGKYFSLSVDSGPAGYLYIGRVPTCPVGGCDSGRPGTGAYEYFDYFILFDSSITVKYVYVYNYQAVRGHEICSPGWLKQFRGYDGSDKLDVGYNIDAISGATKSVSSITANVMLVQKVFMENVG